MEIKICRSIVVILVFCGSCIKNVKEEDFDARYWAKKYCNCLKENREKSDAYNARIICDSKLNLENKFFKIYSASGLSGSYFNSLPKEVKDSVLEFNRVFNMYLFDSCRSFLLDNMTESSDSISENP
ncbi:hypothetical protein [Agriterribacter sp.]|mgnify:CR=1 FL=1|uniref:hypothetical protein n=1 Tax=Agriterribacter sp. TaxID=2821509 RepID=UPI002C765A26|nr:hypothetical protein [Agriterribacter sp.]HRO47335.1 hypothetical protein [Agriterribacter sp.]HRQ18156.1 hypothetical protein [Agriterribacter sp.]